MYEEKRDRIEVIGELLRHAAEKHPDRAFITCGVESLGYGGFQEQSDQLAAGLQAFGVTQGDRVAIFLPNCMEYIVAIYALAKLGAVQVPINTYLRGEFLRHQLAESQASTIIADDLALRQLSLVMEELPDLRAIVQLGASDIDLQRPKQQYHSLLASGAKAKFPDIGPDDLCAILYTSGTTGPSKGCMITHSYYTWVPELLKNAGWSRDGDTIIGATPLFHASAQIWIVGAALNCGGRAVVEPVFHASTFLDRARETRATVFSGMNAMLGMILAQAPSEKDRDHEIRQAIGFAAASADTKQRFLERFGIPIYSDVFGQTECNIVTLTPAGQPMSSGAGKPGAHIELKIFNDKDREVPIGEVGEIVIRPNQPNVMFSGYWNNPQATLSSFRNLWHHTGDFGRLDADGNLHFADRKKDSMRRRGENVSSMELENAIMKHAQIAAVAAHAVPSDLGEDEIKVCIVPASGQPPEPAALFEFFKSALPYYAIPRYVEVMNELPVNPVGRVQKFVLRERGVTPETVDFAAIGLVVSRDDRRK